MSATENLLVLYHIGSLDAVPNCLRLCVHKDKEVYLLDIMHAWLQMQCLPLGVRYAYQAVVGVGQSQQLHPLDSPSSVVPVADSRVTLLLKEAGSAPVVPTAQVPFYLPPCSLLSTLCSVLSAACATCVLPLHLRRMDPTLTSSPFPARPSCRRCNSPTLPATPSTLPTR